MKKILFLSLIAILNSTFHVSLKAAEKSRWVSVKKATSLIMQKIYERGADFITLKNYEGWKKIAYRLLQAGFSFGFVTSLLFKLTLYRIGGLDTIGSLFSDIEYGYIRHYKRNELTMLEFFELVYKITIKFPWTHAWYLAWDIIQNQKATPASVRASLKSLIKNIIKSLDPFKLKEDPGLEQLVSKSISGEEYFFPQVIITPLS